MKVNRLTLRQRLVLIVLLPVVLLAVGLSSFMLQRSTDAADSALRERALAIVSFLAPAAEYGVFAGNRAALQALLGAALEQRDVAAASIVDSEGVVLAMSGRRSIDAAELLRQGTPGRLKVIAHEGGRLAAIAGVELAPLGIDDSGSGEAVIPEVIGWVHVELDTSTLAAYKRELLWSTLGIAASVLLLTLALALWMARGVTRPVASLVSAVGRMTRGDLGSQVKEDAGIDELHVLQRGFNAMARAISEAQQTMQIRIDEATAKLAHQAMHDALTGLPNRRAFEQALEDAVTASRRASDASVLCFIDLDRFKTVNDTSGHAAGDALLMQIASIIRERVRTGDLLCRIGGDEFALILYGCSVPEAHQIADNLRLAVEEYRFAWDHHNFAIGLSIGLVALDGKLTSSGDALVAADLACYAAKRGGRNRIVEHTSLPGDSRF